MHTAARSGFLAALMTASGLAFAASGGCSAKKNTEIMVGVQTDVRVPKDIDEIQLRVLVDGVVVFDPRSPVGDGQASLPGSFGVVAGSERGAPIVVEVLGYVKGNTRVLRRARLTFVQGQTIFLRMPLKFACYDAESCPADQTCIGGECKPADVDSAQLPAYTSATQIYGNGAGSGSDTCFSAEECFASTFTPTSSGDGCTFVLAGATTAPSASGSFGVKRIDTTGTPFTPAIRFPNTSTSLGYCLPAGACFVPVDHDVDEGWEWIDATNQGSFKLATGLCTRMKALGGTLVATMLCGEKTVERPVCTPLGGPIPDTGGDTSGDTSGDTRVDTGLDTRVDTRVEAIFEGSSETGGGVDSGSDAEGGISCGGGLTACNQRCVNLGSDAANCGSCGHACASGQTCASSTCTTAPDRWTGTWSGTFDGTIAVLGLPVTGTATVTLALQGATLTGIGSVGIPAYPSCGATTLPCNGSVVSSGAQLTCTNTAGTLTLESTMINPSTVNGNYAWQTSASGCYPSSGTFTLTLRTSGAETGPGLP
jgi:hypothetical protein